MAKKERRRNEDGCALDMTPMIDVVFQLIIFFIVTFKINDNINQEIVLEDGRHGPIIQEMPPSTLVIEVDKKGHISINGFRMSESKLNDTMRNRVAKLGQNFPLLVRADRGATHAHVRRVMDICTANGVWKLSFVAVKERKN